MAKIDLFIISQGESCFRSYYFVRVLVNTAKDLLERANKLARDYSTFYRFSWHPAKVYIYDPSKKDDYDLSNEDNGLPFNEIFYTPEELYKKGGYSEIVKTVEYTQGVELRT